MAATAIRRKIAVGWLSEKGFRAFLAALVLGTKGRFLATWSNKDLCPSSSGPKPSPVAVDFMFRGF